MNELVRDWYQTLARCGGRLTFWIGEYVRMAFNLNGVFVRTCGTSSRKLMAESWRMGIQLASYFNGSVLLRYVQLGTKMVDEKRRHNSDGRRVGGSQRP